MNNPAGWHGGRPGRDWWRIEDPEWALGFRMLRRAVRAAAERFPGVERVFPGLSPMEPEFLHRAAARGVLEYFDAVAGHDFWMDFGPASELGEGGVDTLAERVDALRDAAEACVGRPLPVVVSEIGVSSFAGDEVQAWATAKTLRALEWVVDRHAATRVTWYSLFDLPEEYRVASLYRKESHGEVRHRKFGLHRFVDGRFRPKEAARVFARRGHPDRIGITQWFRMPWPDPDRGLTAELARDISYRTLEAAPPLLRRLGVEWLRINVTWADWHSAVAGDLEGGLRWFDDLISALEEFRLLVTIFQAPPALVRDRAGYASGSVPRSEHIDGYREAVLGVLERYAPAVARAEVPAGGTAARPGG